MEARLAEDFERLSKVLLSICDDAQGAALALDAPWPVAAAALALRLFPGGGDGLGEASNTSSFFLVKPSSSHSPVTTLWQASNTIHFHNTLYMHTTCSLFYDILYIYKTHPKYIMCLFYYIL